MKNTITAFIALLSLMITGCNSGTQNDKTNTDQSFANFENTFLDAYWKQYPAGSISVGYGKYYDRLVIPDSSAFAGNISFSNNWIDSLTKIDYEKLTENNKISFKIINNQLQSDRWYNAVFKIQEWDASFYNISSSGDYIINQPYAPLDERLRILTHFLEHTDEYYKAALHNLNKPTKEHIELAISQNKGGLDVFGTALTDSIQSSHLSPDERSALQQNIAKAKNAMNGYIDALKEIIANTNYVYRDFRIGKTMFTEKFKFDLATDLTPEQVYEKAVEEYKICHQKMFMMADSVWSKYYPGQSKPNDSLQLVQLILNKIQLVHASPAGFFHSVDSQVYALKKFIVEKKLFDFDTNAAPIKVRYMPVYARGITTASADFIPPYQKQGTAYYNVDDLTLYPPEKAASALREDNYYGSQILSIHEAVPGHCMQSIYNNKKSPDVLRSVFQNGAMIEGWAVYVELMMIENGWGDHSPEIELTLGVWRLRELANVLIDYDIQCLNRPEKEIVNFLTKECFQTSAQVQEKYHRATLSQVQLCSYFSGESAIRSLRDEYKKKMGDKYSLKDFHEKFLSYGSSPVKYIRERMLQ